jgi:hypothetical protein
MHYHRTNFQLPNSSGSLVIATESKAKQNVPTAAM